MARTRASSGESVEVRLNYQQLARATEKLNRAIIHALADPEAKKEIAREAIELARPYVPFDTGRLSGSARTVSHARAIRIKWSAVADDGFNYAMYQWDGPLWWNRNRTVHPLARSHWTNVLTPGGEKYIELAIVTHEIVHRKVKENWGK